MRGPLYLYTIPPLFATGTVLKRQLTILTNYDTRSCPKRPPPWAPTCCREHALVNWLIWDVIPCLDFRLEMLPWELVQDLASMTDYMEISMTVGSRLDADHMNLSPKFGEVELKQSWTILVIVTGATSCSEVNWPFSLCSLTRGSTLSFNMASHAIMFILMPSGTCICGGTFSRQTWPQR